MDFGFTDEQEALRKSAREFLTERSTTQLVRTLMENKTGFDEGLWKEMAQLGWMGAAIPEEDGGLGLGMIELSILAEETGRALLPSPFYSSVGLAAPVIAAAADGTLRKELLGGIASGDTRATVALPEADGRWDAGGVKTKAVRAGDGYTITGTKVCWAFTKIKGITKPLASHIHKGGVGVSGPVVVPLGAAFKPSGCTNAPAAVTKATLKSCHRTSSSDIKRSPSTTRAAASACGSG